MQQAIGSTKNEGFSLTSGDFPTLGSERDNSVKESDSHGNYLMFHVSLQLSSHRIRLCCSSGLFGGRFLFS